MAAEIFLCGWGVFVLVVIVAWLFDTLAVRDPRPQWLQQQDDLLVEHVARSLPPLNWRAALLGLAFVAFVLAIFIGVAL